MKLLVGLGNPGKKYATTRHNIGQIILDKLRILYAPNESCKNSISGNIQKFDIENRSILALYPNSFMNLSGQPIYKAMNFYKIKISDLIVMHDDIDLKLGVIKTKIGGGSGGHNGVNSIDLQLTSKDYKRIRIGVGRPENKFEVPNYVLQNFKNEELEQIFHSIETIINFILT